MKKTLAAVPGLVLLLSATSALAAGLPLEVRERSALAQARFAERFPDAVVHARPGALPTLVTALSAALPTPDAGGAHLFIREWADLFGLDLATGDLQFLRMAGLPHGTVYRYAQQYRGLPVLEGDIVVTVDREGRAAMISSGVQPVDGIPVEFTVTRDDAIFAALRELNPALPTGQVQKAVKAVANIGGAREAVWVIDIPAEQPFGFWRIYVARDALRVVGMRNRMLNAKGNAYPDSPELGAYTAVTLPNLTGGTKLSGPYVDVYTGCSPAYGSCTKRNAVADGNGDFLYTPKEGQTTDQFAEVNAFYHLNNMHDFFSDNGFSYMDTLIKAGVNYTGYGGDCTYACNAFYANNSVTMGLCNTGSQCNQSGVNVNFSYDADVFMHEYTHGAVEHSAGLGMYEIDQYGLMASAAGMNEGYADYFAGIATNDPVTGRHIDKMMPGTLTRDMSQVGTCPGEILGESHEDGKVWASANWTAFKAGGDDPNVPKAVLMTLPGLSNMPTMQDAANATLAVAASYGNAQARLQKAYEDHGILECGRSAPVQNPAFMSMWLLNPQMLGIQTSSTPGAIQYKLNVPAVATRIDVTVAANDMATWQDVTSRVKVYINQGSPVTYSSSPSADWNTAGKASYTINAPAAGDYYFLAVGSSFGQSQGYQTQITAQFFTDTPYDAGTPDAGKTDAGVKPDAGGKDGGTAADAGKTDAGPAKDGGTVIDAGKKDGGTVVTDAGAKDTGGATPTDTGATPGEDTGGGGGGGGDCQCDTTYGCDENCECDPDCTGANATPAAGCSCSTVGM